MIHDLKICFVGLLELVAQYRTALLLGGCAALGAAGAWLVAGTPFRRQLMDTPNERSSHTVPTPRGGGVGILAAFIMAGLTLRIPTTFLFAALIVSAVSFFGDYYRISVKFRLVVQAFSTSILLFPMLPRLTEQYALSVFAFSPFIFLIFLPFMFLFVIGTANFFNFMDGINGIAGLSGLVGFGMLGFYTLHRSQPDAFHNALSVLSLCVCLACLGYLPFNMPRARVFMGDVGSILLGFVFAGLVLMLSRDYLEMVCLAALFAPFYADELTTMAVRMRSRENIFRSHRRHLYQLLVNQLGIEHWKIASIYAIAQLAVGTGALMIHPLGSGAVLIFLTACFVGFVSLTVHIRKVVDKKEQPR